MLRSMTAYGRADLVQALGRCVVEMHSVNRRHLELRLNLPRPFLRFDPLIRDCVGKQLTRGQVSVSVNMDFGDASPTRLQVDKSLAQQYLDAWRSVSEEMAPAPWEWILQQEGVLSTESALEELEDYEALVLSAVDEACKALISMKEGEGKALANAFEEGLSKVAETVQVLEAMGDSPVSAYREKLLARLSELSGASVVDDERILREVAVYADRIDIHEELVRIKSHVQQAQELIRGPEHVVGKALEFILQELMRESNTVAAKVGDPDAGQRVVLMKAEIERMREQVQNVE